MPPDYPQAYVVPEGGNTASYHDRGWCFCEESMAAMVKSTHLVIAVAYPTSACGGKLLSNVWQ